MAPQRIEHVAANDFDVDREWDRLPLGELRQLDGICLRFEQALAQAPDARLEPFIGDLTESQQRLVVPELVRLAVERRHACGQRPTPDEYARQFPQWADGLRQVVASGLEELDQRRHVADRETLNCAADDSRLSPSMPQFQNQLVESRIVVPEAMQAVLDGMPAASRPRDARQLARLLVEQRMITAYQARQVLAGRGPSLVLGNYMILDELGQGGMGLVLKAQHRRMKRVVALKVLAPQVTKSPEALRRFQREVEAAAHLTHPNIVTAHDADEAQQTHFLVMEYVDGADLASLVKERGPLSVDQAISCVLQAARGLEYAHKRGLVHRDIKPANLLLDTQGTVKVLNMGLARLESAGDEQDQLTGSGQVMGTTDYMAPEQALSTKDADARADIYSLGITLWYLLTGRAVYGGESALAKLLAHRESSIPSLCSACPNVSPRLDKVFQRMVAKRPDDRYPNMSAVIADLEPCSSGSDTLSTLVAESRAANRRRKEAGDRTPADGIFTSTKAAALELPGHAADSFAPTLALHSAQLETSRAAHPAREHESGDVRPRPQSPRRGGYVVWIAGGGGALSLLLAALVFFLQTKDGAIRVEINDPTIEVAIQGTEIVLKQADQGQDVRLSPGAKTLVVQRGDFRFETDKLVLKRGDAVTVQVTLQADKLEVRQGTRLLGEGRLPGREPVDSARQPEAAVARPDADGQKLESPKPRFTPRIVGSFPTTSQADDVEIVGTRAYLADGKGGVKILDVRNPTRPALLGTFATAGHVNSVRVLDRLAFVADELKGLIILDVSEPAQPVRLGAVEGAQLVSVYVDGKLAYGADLHGQLRIYDIRNPAAPLQIGTFKTRDCARDVQVIGGRAYVADDRGGVFIVDVRDPANPALISNIRPGDDLGQAMQLRVVGTTVFVANGSAGLAILDASDPSHPRVVSHTPSGFAAGLQVRGDFAYVAAQLSVNIVDISNPARPKIVSQAKTEEISHRLAVAENLLYVADRFGGLQVIDMTSTAAPANTTQVDHGTPLAKSNWSGWPADSPAPAVAPFTADQAQKHQQAWAGHLGLPVEITNGIGMKFVLIPPGEFAMGSTPAEIQAALDIQSEPHWRKCIQSQGPQHKVILTRPYYLAVHQVTQAEYEKFMGKNPSFFTPKGDGKDVVGDVDTSRFPVEHVSWIDAREFCAKLTEHERIATEDAGYVLPTEAQWEFACRAGTTTRHWLGDSPDELSRIAWVGTNSSGRMHAGGELPANPFGLFDMLGNASDWVRDEWEPTYYETLTGKLAIDPVGPTDGDTLRVARGGNWNLDPTHCMASSRTSLGLGNIDRSVGFRLSLSVESARHIMKPRRSPEP